MRLQRPGFLDGGRGTFHVGRGDGARRAACPDHRKVDAELAGKGAHRRRGLDAPGLAPTFRRRLGRPLLLARDGAHHGAAVGLLRRFELDQRRAGSDDVARFGK
jgi:hypothetical protein